MDNQKQDLKKQIIFYCIILIIVIIFAIIVNIDIKKEENTTENEIVYEINGITEEDLEILKDQMDQDTYNEYKSLFEAYKNGEAKYVPENAISEEDKMTGEEVDDYLNNIDENGTFYYYKTEDGQNTDIKIYTNLVPMD